MSQRIPRAVLVLSLSPLLATGLWSCEQAEVVNDTPVRATLDDGQVLMGGVTTEVLELVTGFGTVEVPLGDVGEVRPVEGGDLGGSGNHVSVWLRNGSELRGEWAEPELEMALDIAGELVAVDLPMDDLERFQLQDGDLMPRGEVFRIRTVYGDDFVVDAEETMVSLQNHLGRFEPTLGEVSSLSQILTGWPDGQLTEAAEDEPAMWRMSLESGSVLIGALEGAGEDPGVLELTLPLGPELLTLSVSEVVSIERQDWGGYDSWYEDSGMGVQAPAAAEQGEWFDNRRQSGFKSAQ